MTGLGSLLNITVSNQKGGDNVKVMAVPKVCAYAVTAVCILGIIVGSFFDFSINVALANKTDIGAFFAVIAYFMAVYYSNNYNGSKVRELFGYTAGDSSPLLSAACWGFWVVLYAWVPFVCYRIFDDADPDKLIMTGAAILIAGIAADNINLWFKQVASRPRYKYLITLDDPMSEFRNWWQMVPYLAGSNDSYKSWPSGNMTIASMMFSLPMLSDVLKKRSEKKNMICFIIASCFVIIYGYNRIHMTNHFLSDVCFGTLITYIIYSVVSKAFLNTVKK